MKQLPPNALRSQLAQAQAAGPHPDADLLSAFAEGSLLDRERADLLAHLAGCPACRAILQTSAIAAPEPETIPQSRPARPPMRSWVPGVALAASLLVMAASSVLFYRAITGAPRTQTLASAPAPVAAVPPPPAPAPEPQAAAKPARTNPPKRIRTTVPPRSPASVPVLATSQAAPSAPSPSAPPITVAGAASGVSLGELPERNASPPADQARMQAELRANVSAFHGAAAAEKEAPPLPATAAARFEPQPGFAASRREPMGAISGLMTVRPRYRITDAGQLERSIQPGVWQPVPISQPVHFRVLSISGADVWAGGDHLRLFHSADDGVTWTEVQLPAAANHDNAIVHIRIDAVRRLTVEDGTGATWTTTDGGATWQ